MNISAVVFDLDETLANTEALGGSHRTPSLVLNQSPPGVEISPLAINRQRSNLPGELIAKGYKVAITTTYSPAYASTLCGLLGLDYHRLATKTAGRTGQKLIGLAHGWAITPENILYVGNQSEESEATNRAGCYFLPKHGVAELFSFPSLVGLPPRETSQVDLSPQELDERRQTNRPQNHASVEPIRCPDCGRNNLRVPLFNRDGACWNCSADLWGSGWLGRFIIESCQNKRALSEQEIKSLEGNSNNPRNAALAMIALHAVPGQTMRTRLQTVAFAHFAPQYRDCLITLELDEGQFGFPPWLLTQAEIRVNPNLKNIGLGSASDLFPSISEHAIHHNSWIRSMTSFQNLRYGDPVMRKLKDWGGMSSGPKVFHSLGYFPSLAIAGNVKALLGNGKYSVVPVPSSLCSQQKPGQFSLRLGHEVAQLLGSKTLTILDYGVGHGGIRCTHMGKGTPIAVIDDQYTFGGSMDTAISSLETANFDVKAAFTWSRSVLPERHPQQQCFFDTHLRRLVTNYPCNC